MGLIGSKRKKSFRKFSTGWKSNEEKEDKKSMEAEKSSGREKEKKRNKENLEGMVFLTWNPKSKVQNFKRFSILFSFFSLVFFPSVIVIELGPMKTNIPRKYTRNIARSTNETISKELMDDKPQLHDSVSLVT
jgi:hypothetical protein